MLKQSGNLSVTVHINIFCRGLFRKSRHSHYISRQHDNKACPGGNLKISHGYGEILRRAEQGRIVREAVLRFGNAHRKSAEAEPRKLVKLFSRLRCERHTLTAVNLGYYSFNFILYRQIKLIGIPEVSLFLLAKPYNLFRKLDSARAAVRPNG